MVTIANEMESLTAMFEEADDLNGRRKQEEERAAGGKAITQGPLGPGDIGKPRKKPAAAKKPVKQSDDIWDENEVPEEDLAFGADDGDERPEPEYKTAYKQRVRSEDMFLGIDGKDPGSHCCEDLIVTVMLPGVKAMAEISLDVTKNTLRASTPQHKLAMYLPHTVRDKDGSAQWDSDKCELRLTLPIDHVDIMDLPDREEIVEKYRKEAYGDE